MFRKTVILIGSAILLSACVATSIPTTTKVSDTIMMGVKTSLAKAVSYEYKANIEDGTIKPCDKDTRNEQASHPGYMHTEGATLDKMLRDYMAMKFSNVDSTSDPKIKVTLKDFWLEQYSTDSTGKQWLVALGGGEINIMVVAHLDMVFEISKAGASVTKTIRVSGDSAHVTGIGTGTSTSNIDRGNQNIEFRVADAINAANNKAIIMLNQFFESNQL